VYELSEGLVRLATWRVGGAGCGGGEGGGAESESDDVEEAARAPAGCAEDILDEDSGRASSGRAGDQVARRITGSGAWATGGWAGRELGVGGPGGRSCVGVRSKSTGSVLTVVTTVTRLRFLGTPVGDNRG
jgi:hypothetical protein